MKKRNIILGGAALAAVLLWIGIATAYGGMGRMGGFGIMGAGGANMVESHQEMYKIMEEGKYSDLAALRDKLGFRIMPWVESEQDFELAKGMHEKMEKYHEQAGMPMGGMMKGMGAGGMGGCPMMG